MTTAEIENLIAVVRDSFFRALAGRSDAPANELQRTANGLALLRAAGVPVDAATLWGKADHGRCQADQLPIWLAVAGAVAGLGESA